MPVTGCPANMCTAQCFASPEVFPASKRPNWSEQFIQTEFDTDQGWCAHCLPGRRS